MKAKSLDPENVTEELKQIVDQWNRAIVANDPEAIGPFMAGDWSMVSTEGGISTKGDFLDAIKSGDLIHDRMEFDPVQIRIFDNAAIVIARGISAGKYKGMPFHFPEWSTDFFVKTGQTWLCELTMITPSKV